MATQKTVQLSNYYMRKEGTNGSEATQSAKGLMSSTDKTKLDGIATNANNYVHPSTIGTRKDIGLYNIAINANGHIISADQIPIELSSETYDTSIYDITNDSSLMHTDWDTTYNIFDVDISELITGEKGFSTNDYTTAEKNKLANLQISDISGLSNALSTAISYFVISNVHATGIFGSTEITDSSFDNGMKTFIAQNQGVAQLLTKENTICLLPNNNPISFFYEYMYLNGKFELLGTNKDIDLSPYMLTSDFDDFYDDEYSVDLPLKADKAGGVAQVTDAQASTYTNIGTLSNNATQQSINNAINTALTGNVKDSNLVDKLDGIVQQLIQLGE